MIESDKANPRGPGFIKIDGRMIFQGDPDYPAADAEMTRRIKKLLSPSGSLLFKTAPYRGYGGAW